MDLERACVPPCALSCASRISLAEHAARGAASHVPKTSIAPEPISAGCSLTATTTGATMATPRCDTSARSWVWRIRRPLRPRRPRVGAALQPLRLPLPHPPRHSSHPSCTPVRSPGCFASTRHHEHSRRMEGSARSDAFSLVRRAPSSCATPALLTPRSPPAHGPGAGVQYNLLVYNSAKQHMMTSPVAVSVRAPPPPPPSGTLGSRC